MKDVFVVLILLFVCVTAVHCQTELKCERTPSGNYSCVEVEHVVTEAEAAKTEELQAIITPHVLDTGAVVWKKDYHVPNELDWSGWSTDESGKPVQVRLARLDDNGKHITAPVVKASEIGGDNPGPHGLDLILTTPARAIVSFSPGQDVGKGIYVWRADTRNLGPNVVNLDAGDVEAAAIWAGLAPVGPDEARISNDLQRNKSKPIIGASATQGILEGITGGIAMRIISATGPWGAGVYFGSLAAKMFVTYLKSVSPADFETRFKAAIVLVDNSSFTLAPVTEKGHSQVSYIFTRTKKGAKPIPDVLIK